MFLRLYTIAVLTCMVFFFCNNAAQDEACSGPTIHGCGGSQCIYSYIYNDQGQFINEAVSNGVSAIMWNGTDCRGNSVPCGKYRVEHHMVVSGQERTATEEILLTDSTGTSAGGNAACDSLKGNCSGKYAESIGSFIGSDGTLHSGERTCICCE